MIFKLFVSVSTLVLVCAVIPVPSSYGQSRDCTKFKNGLFKIVNSISGTSYINRQGTRQSELIEGKKDSTVLIVQWIDDCTYTLTPTKEMFECEPGLPRDAMMTVQIIEVRDGSYVQITSANFSDMKLTNEVIRIR